MKDLLHKLVYLISVRIIIIHRHKITLMIEKNTSLYTSQESLYFVFFVKPGSTSGIITVTVVVHTVCWSTITISSLGSLNFRQIRFEHLESRTLVLVEERNSVMTNFVEVVNVVSDTLSSRTLVSIHFSGTTVRPRHTVRHKTRNTNS